MLLRTATLSLLALAMGSSAAWAANEKVAQRQDVTLALANDLLSATLTACHAEGRTGVGARGGPRGPQVGGARVVQIGPPKTPAGPRQTN